MRPRLAAAAAALLLTAAAGAGWVASTVGTPTADGVSTGAEGGAESWSIVVIDTTTGTSSGVFAGPGTGPAVVPGSGFTENYLSELLATQAEPGRTLLSSVIGPHGRTDATVGTPVDAGDGLRPVLVALAGLGLVAVLGLVVAVLLGWRRGRPVAAVVGALLAGALGALTVGLGVLGTWSPVLGASALTAGVAAAALHRDADSAVLRGDQVPCAPA